MKSTFLLPLLLGITVVNTPLARADWPQWRGPNRNGVAGDDAKLPAELTDENGPKKLWESESIPSDHDGGHGSVVVADGKVFLSVVWHSDVPTETRRFDSRAMSALGFRGTNGLDPDVVAAMEHERENLGRRMRGAALDEWAQKWVEEHLDKKTQLSLGSWIIGRFKQGKSAIPISVYETLQEAGKREFANQAEMEAWVNEQGFDPDLAKRIINAVPSTRKVANDVVVCVNADTGETIWKFTTPGSPTGRGSSSTPAVSGGKVFAALSDNLYALDVKDGTEIWRAPLSKKGPASSPLVVGDHLYLQENQLTAYHAGTGEKLWQNQDANGSNPSPAIWSDGDRAVILCNGTKSFVGVDAATGDTLWTTDGGGDSTPSVSGDVVVIASKEEGKNLIAYRLKPDGSGPEQLWSRDFLARRYGSSPIIHGDRVFHLGSERHLCVDLKTGETIWEREASSSISSPMLADGKLCVYENRGGFLALIDAEAAEYRSLGRAKVGALYCASPAIVGKRLYLRTPGSVVAFEFP
ncbi:MAG: PQQ-binding-like beta-propeller repeat protein [Verrucomicrobiae bacterium]|nr:PQQ-binding-like beta-propeller repeat protein [Verrucomicrobiae bacterium]